jgi:uncharacterized protein
MSRMLNLLFWLVAIYLLICVGAVLAHRHFVYLPDPMRYTPADAGASGIEEIEISAPDGVTLLAWHARAKEGRPTLLYFTGNGGSAATRVSKIQQMQDDGYGVFMLNYRGYGGSGGKPTEANNLADAERAYDRLVSLGVKPEDIVAYGESLGTAVATRMALVRPVRAVVLEAPFTSIVDVGKRTWWFLPLNIVMLDRYRTIDYIPDLTVPLLIVHGDRDGIIPVSHAQRLYDIAPQPKSLVILPGGNHNNLYDQGAWQHVRAFLESGDGSASAMTNRHPEVAA